MARILSFKELTHRTTSAKSVFEDAVLEAAVPESGVGIASASGGPYKQAIIRSHYGG